MIKSKNSVIRSKNQSQRYLRKNKGSKMEMGRARSKKAG